MKSFIATGLIAVAILGAPAAQAATIDFEGYVDPTNVPVVVDSGATFAALGATTGFEISAYGQATWGTVAPQILCPRTSANYCGGDFEVTFASGISMLQFYFTGDNSATPLSVQAFLGATLLGTSLFNGDGAPLTAHLVDLSSYGSVSRIVVTGASADAAGFGYDDFSFAESNAVPEPGSWALMLLGFGLMGSMLRRRSRSGTPQAA